MKIHYKGNINGYISNLNFYDACLCSLYLGFTSVQLRINIQLKRISCIKGYELN